MGKWEDMTRVERQEMVSNVWVSAVNKEIKKDPRIKGKEAKLIHALLKGRAR